jgi:predicted transcriptional regulator
MTYKRQVLNILAENLKNSQPQVVESCKIAERLDMELKETCQLIKVMNKMGIVESDQDGQRSLITRDGLHFLASLSFSRAA